MTSPTLEMIVAVTAASIMSLEALMLMIDDLMTSQFILIASERLRYLAARLFWVNRWYRFIGVNSLCMKPSQFSD
jgi:hypothetical protein